MSYTTSEIHSAILHIPKGGRLAIVGSTELTGDEPRELIHVIITEKWPDVVISGGADGIDSTAADVARIYGRDVIEHLPKTKNWRGYKARNILIADDCDALIRIAWRYSRTYGSGWTRDRARSLGKPVAEFVLDTTG